MIKVLRKIDDAIAHLEKWGAIIALSGLLGTMLYSIIGRNVFGYFNQAIVELSSPLVVWFALLGASLALKHKRHIKLELFLRYLPESTALAAHKVTGLFGGVLCCLLFISSLSFVTNEYEIFGAKGALAVIFPLFFLTTAFRFFLQTTSSKT